MQCAHGRFDFKQKRWWWWSCNPDMKMFWSGDGLTAACRWLSWRTRDATLSANPTNQPLFKPPKDWRNESNKQYTPIKEATEQNNFSPCSSKHVLNRWIRLWSRRLNMQCGYMVSVSLSPFQLFESYLMQKNDYYLSGGQLANGDTWGRHCLPAKCFLMVGVKADPATFNQHTCTRSQ